jgi:hypothetical protein
MSNFSRLKGLKDREKNRVILKRSAVIVRSQDVLNFTVIALLLGLIVMGVIVLIVLILRIMKAIAGKLSLLLLIEIQMLLNQKLRQLITREKRRLYITRDAIVRSLDV